MDESGRRDASSLGGLPPVWQNPKDRVPRSRVDLVIGVTVALRRASWT